MAAPISLRLTFGGRKENTPKKLFFLSKKFCLLLLPINSAPTFDQSEFPRNFPYSHASHVFLPSKPLFLHQILLTELIIVTIARLSFWLFSSFWSFLDLPSFHGVSRGTLCSWNIQMLSLNCFPFQWILILISINIQKHSDAKSEIFCSFNNTSETNVAPWWDGMDWWVGLSIRRAPREGAKKIGEKTTLCSCFLFEHMATKWLTINWEQLDCDCSSCVFSCYHFCCLCVHIDHIETACFRCEQF